MGLKITLLLLLLLCPLVAHAQTPGASQYPTALDDAVSTPQAADGKYTALTAAINNSVTTLPVISTTGWPATVVLQIDSEYIACTGSTSTTFTSCTRGFNGSTAIAHAANATVRLPLSAPYVNGQRGAVIEVEKKIGRGASNASSASTGAVLTKQSDGSTAWQVGGGSGEVNTASNVNAGGVGVFKQKSGVDLQFRGVNAGSNKITVTNDTGNNEIDIDVAEANLTLSNMGGSLDASKIGSGTLPDARIASAATWNAKQSALGYTPANVAGDTFTGTVNLNSSLAFTGNGSFAPGRMYKDAANGMILALATGTTTDFFLVSPAGGNIMTVKTGSVNTTFWGAVQLTAITEPSTPSSGTFFLYVDSADNKAKLKGPSGTVTILANP